MDLDYDGEDAEVNPVVFTSGVYRTRTDPGIGLGQVGLIHH